MMLGAITLALLVLWQPSPSAGSASPLPKQTGSAAISPSAPPAPYLPGVTTAPLPTAPADAVVIRNSGSTNTAGYLIIVRPDGRTLIAQNGQTRSAVLARPQTRWLFAKLREAGRLSDLPRGHCLQSASFGATTTLVHEGGTSGDLGCAVSPIERELARTVGVIVRQLRVSTYPSHRLRLLRGG